MAKQRQHFLQSEGIVRNNSNIMIDMMSIFVLKWRCTIFDENNRVIFFFLYRIWMGLLLHRVSQLITIDDWVNVTFNLTISHTEGGNKSKSRFCMLCFESTVSKTSAKFILFHIWVRTYPPSSVCFTNFIHYTHIKCVNWGYWIRTKPICWTRFVNSKREIIVWFDYKCTNNYNSKRVSKRYVVICG